MAPGLEPATGATGVIQPRPLRTFTVTHDNEREMMTRTTVLGMALVTGLAWVQPNHAAAQDSRAEVARTIEIASQKIIGLAETMTQDQYAWRPTEGVRSVSEVFMHIAGTNWWFPTLIGGTPPSESGVTADYGGTVPRLEEVMEKDAIVAALRSSFDYLLESVRDAPADELENPVNMFGTPTTVRGVLIETTIHLHEHLGQSIAYARAQGVTPPWS